MSTEIGEIFEIEPSQRHHNRINKSEYCPAYMWLTRFYGGNKNDRMLQITIQSDQITYIQLTQKQVQELAKTLNECFDDNKYPSE